MTDSITLVVSEETGNISIAQRGTLTQTNPEALRRFLTNKLIPDVADAPQSVLSPVINTARNISSNFTRGRQNAKNHDDRVKAIEIVDLRSNKEAQPQKEQTKGGTTNGK